MQQRDPNPLSGPPSRRPRTCPYCGAKLRDGQRACSAHSDLPALDPAAPTKRVTVK